MKIRGIIGVCQGARFTANTVPSFDHCVYPTAWYPGLSFLPPYSSLDNSILSFKPLLKRHCHRSPSMMLQRKQPFFLQTLIVDIT